MIRSRAVRGNGPVDENTNAEGAPEQRPPADPSPAAPPASAEVTAALDPSTNSDILSPVQVPATEVDRPAPGDRRYPFLEPGTRPGSLGRLGHYEVLEVLGEGGFGIVLKAFDEKLQRLVALKVLGPQLVGNATARGRFVREARAAAAVNCRYVVSTYE